MTDARFGLTGRLHAAFNAFRAPERLRSGPCDEAALAMLMPAVSTPKAPSPPTDLLSLSFLPFDS